MNTIFEPLKVDIFDKSLFIQNNQFVLLFSSEIKYEDYGYEYLTKSVIYAQLENNIYSFRLFRENDQQLIAELTLELKNNLVYLLKYNLKSEFKSDRNARIQSTNNLKFLTVFFLSFMQANSKELFFGAIDQENKTKFNHIFKYLNL